MAKKLPEYVREITDEKEIARINEIPMLFTCLYIHCNSILHNLLFCHDD